MKGAHRLFMSGAAILSMACHQTLDLGGNTAGLSLVEPVIVVPQDGKPATLHVTLAGDAMAKAHVNPVFDPPLPPGVCMTTFAHDAADGTIVFSAARCPGAATPMASPGDYPLRVRVDNADTRASSAFQNLLLTVAVVATIKTEHKGAFREFVSTSLQPAPFQLRIPNPQALADLTTEPIHVQIYDPPWKGSTEQGGVWNFDELNGVLKPLLERNASVQLQIYTGPQITGGPRPPPIDIRQLALYKQYCLGLVRYYNHVDGGPGQSTFSGKVGWWSILGDCNNKGTYCSLLQNSDYNQVYNEVAAAMREVDPTIKISALEATDSVVVNTPRDYLGGFFAAPDAGGIDRSQVDSIAVHMFGATQSKPPPDDSLFSAVPVYAGHIGAIVSQLQDAGMPDVDVWVTQANVSANVPGDPAPDGAPRSGLDPGGGPLILDTRGTGAFFVSWQAYMFSLLGQAGGNALFHWNYTAGHDPDGGISLDTQNAEVNYDDGGTYPSYWVDRWLGQMFPSGVGHQVLDNATTETTKTVDVLATDNDDGTVVVMVTNVAVDETADGGGVGLPRAVIVDVSALVGADAGFSLNLSSVSTLTVDAHTNASSMPTRVPAPGARPTVILPDYGVAFLTFAKSRRSP